MTALASQPGTSNWKNGLRARSLVPLWTVLGGMLPPEPTPPAAGVPKRASGSSTEVFCVAEGKGSTAVIGVDGVEKRFDWRQHDHFVIPGWLQFRHEPGIESILFSFSDGPLQHTMGLWRDMRK